MNFKKEFPNLSVETNFKYLKTLKNRLNKISLFMESIDYIIPPVIVLPNNMLKVTYSCGHSHLVRQDHFLEGRLCTTQPCFHIRQSSTMIQYNKEHPENSINISKGTISGMQNMTKENKEKMIMNSIKGHLEKDSYKNGWKSIKELLNHYDFRIRYIIKQSNKFRAKPSALERKFESILRDLNINYFSQAWLDFYETHKTWFICDFYLWDYNLFINIDGFFHQVDKDHVERDNLLDSICDKYNINILHISENDLLNKDFDLKGLLVNYNEVTK